MQSKKPLYLNVEECVDHIVDIFGNDIRIGMPLGLGKPVPLINALYKRAKNNPEISLTIFTALSLEKPPWTNELERRFMQPFVERVFEGVPDLEYMKDLRGEGIPDNITLHEIFCKAGAYVNDPKMQQNYMNTNYTHVVRDCSANDNRIFAHMISCTENGSGKTYSASCNADNSLETLHEFEMARKRGEKRLRIGMVNAHLPFMYGDAELPPEAYDIIIETDEGNHPLFNTPRLSIADSDYMIGLHVSTLIKDGGTLQIGIGALGDAIASGLDLRHNHNETYRKLLADTGIEETCRPLIEEIGGKGTFEKGIYGSTEMLVDGFLQLYKSGIIKRKVYHHHGIQALINRGELEEEIPSDILSKMIDAELIHPYLTQKDFESLQRFGVFKPGLRYDNGEIVDPERKRRYSPLLADRKNLEALSAECLGERLIRGVVLTGGFFIGPRDFYETLLNMSEKERRQFEMTGVEVANQLYGDEKLRALQRKDGRFCNTGMKATLLGHIVSDGLEDGTVISGVGGQYNFVAMAHALPDGRLIMLIKSTREENGKTLSNIVYNYGHVTIPRHLRDIVVTEYGIADIRGKCDQDIIKAMLNIADSRFQDELLAEAKKHKKIPADYQIPEQYRNNTPERIAEKLKDYKALGLFGPFPFGSEFDITELILAHSLRVLKQKTTNNGTDVGALIQKMPDEPPEKAIPMLQRMDLDEAGSPEEKQMQKTVLAALHLAGMG